MICSKLTNRKCFIVCYGNLKFFLQRAENVQGAAPAPGSSARAAVLRNSNQNGVATRKAAAYVLDFCFGDHSFHQVSVQVSLDVLDDGRVILTDVCSGVYSQVLPLTRQD